MLELRTDRQKAIIINSVVKACGNINELNPSGYNFISLSSGFIAHYNLGGFINHYTRYGLRTYILHCQSQNQCGNFLPGQENYEYYMQRKEIYNTICDRIKEVC